MNDKSLQRIVDEFRLLGRDLDFANMLNLAQTVLLALILWRVW